MSILHKFSSGNRLPKKDLSNDEKFSVYYHDIFAYPLSFSELVKWTPKNVPEVSVKIDFRNGFYFVKGRGGLVYKQSLKKRQSTIKLNDARKKAKLLSHVPGIKFIGITGSLAMENAQKGSDIDLVIITKKDTLWAVRLLVYIFLTLWGIKRRKPSSLKQKDALCLNIWLDEDALSWKAGGRNFYTAHEILQIKPLINKDATYERFLYKNKWVLKFWPSVVDIHKPKIKEKMVTEGFLNKIVHILNILAFKLQYSYMKPKITREKVSIKRAIFHPNDLSKEVLAKIRLDNHF